MNYILENHYMFGDHSQLPEGESSQKTKLFIDIKNLFVDDLNLSELQMYEVIDQLNSAYDNYQAFLYLDSKSLPGSGIYGKKGHEKKELIKLKKLVNRGWYEKAVERTDIRFRIKYARLFRLFQDGLTVDAMALIDEYIEQLDNQPESHSIPRAEGEYINSLISIWESVTGKKAAYSANDDNITGWRSPCSSLVENCFRNVGIKFASTSSLNQRVIEVIKRRRAFK